LTFDFNSTITNLWGAELVNQNGSKVTVKNPSWAPEFSPGDKVIIGFIASTGSDKEAPTNYSFN